MSDQLRLDNYLEHMRVSARDAISFTEGMVKADFLVDRRTQQAVTMSVIIVGEAATKVMDRHPDFVEAHPDIPWRSMRGMRNRLTHGYFDVDLNIVWQTVESALPALVEQLDQLR